MRRAIPIALILLLPACGGGDVPAAGGAGEPDASEGATSDTARLAAPPVGAQPLPGSDTLPAATPAGEGWTAGVTRVERDHVGVATVVATRIARHEGFERLVLEMEAGDTIPGYRIAYVDRPVRQCGSGETVAIAGDGWLSIRLEPARAHTDEGRPTLQERHLRPDQPLVLEAVLTCDFEAQLEWVLGVSTPNRYRVLELTDPARLVVDIRSD